MINEKKEKLKNIIKGFFKEYLVYENFEKIEGDNFIILDIQIENLNIFNVSLKINLKDNNKNSIYTLLENFIIEQRIEDSTISEEIDEIENNDYKFIILEYSTGM